MNLKAILQQTEGRLLYQSDHMLEREYRYAVASDLMSNVMLDTADNSVLITGLVNAQVIRASEMMNISCIVLTGGKTVTDSMVDLAKTRNIALMETKLSMFTTCAKLHNMGLTEGPVSSQDTKVTSIRLEENHCNGCTHCMKRCPTEAIRVRNGKANIMGERCIECGLCVKVCPRHASRPIIDSLDSFGEYDYRIAIPASAFFGQFKDVKSRNHLLTALKKIGFDEIYEEAIGAEMVSFATRKLLQNKQVDGPLISSGCPSILKLIQIKFPNLISNVNSYRPPVEVVAELARAEAQKQHPDRKIGIFYIAPCTAKISFIKESDEIVESEVDAMIAISDIYKQVLFNLKTLKEEEVNQLEKTGVLGLRWTNPGGESLALRTDKFIAVDGIEEAIDIFEKVEDDKLDEVDFIEAEACVGGCFGGSLTVENVYSARTNMKKIIDEAKRKYGEKVVNISGDDSKLVRNRNLVYRPVLQLDSDLKASIQKMEEMARITSTLPGIDCGVCGAPTCKAFAEDVVKGFAVEEACVVNDTRTR